jgi:hypothetical protein
MLQEPNVNLIAAKINDCINEICLNQGRSEKLAAEKKLTLTTSQTSVVKV